LFFFVIAMSLSTAIKNKKMSKKKTPRLLPP
jgi:hypothetical protein